MFHLYRQLRRSGVLSINQRNSDFVLKYNARSRYPLVDNKLKSKRLANTAGIAVPPLYTVIKHEHELKNLETILSPYSDFVIKPAQGAGGDGIIVIKDRVFGNKYRHINGKLSTTEDLRHHLSSLLSGAYSLGGRSDCALIEHRVVVDPVFEAVSYEGIPDIRVIVLLGYPAMAMVRLPTRFSAGKANLHQGAIGVGVNLANGMTLGGVFQHDMIDYHPDTLNPIVGIEVPYWDTILKIAAQCYELTGLGYLGVDIVLDKSHGPLMLEINARPGLSIQIANREGALGRYRLIEKQAASQALSVDERVKFSKEMFCVTS
jgi:alpha-L-glutamate ligase-like protein